LRSWKVHNKLELESDPIDRSIYTSSLNKTIRDCIERKLPDRLYNSLSKKDITTLANLKEAAMDLGHWDADPFDNNRPRRQDIRRNSGSTHQNYYYQKYNSHSHGYPRYNNNNNSRDNNNSNNSTNPQGSPNRNQIPSRNQGNYHELRRNLDQGRAQNPLNFQTATSNNFQTHLLKDKGRR